MIVVGRICGGQLSEGRKCEPVLFILLFKEPPLCKTPEEKVMHIGEQSAAIMIAFIAAAYKLTPRNQAIILREGEVLEGGSIVAVVAEALAELISPCIIHKASLDDKIINKIYSLECLDPSKILQAALISSMNGFEEHDIFVERSFLSGSQRTKFLVFCLIED